MATISRDGSGKHTYLQVSCHAPVAGELPTLAYLLFSLVKHSLPPPILLLEQEFSRASHCSLASGWCCRSPAWSLALRVKGLSGVTFSSNKEMTFPCKLSPLLPMRAILDVSLAAPHSPLWTCLPTLRSAVPVWKSSCLPYKNGPKASVSLACQVRARNKNGSCCVCLTKHRAYFPGTCQQKRQLLPSASLYQAIMMKGSLWCDQSKE